ncbi:hypothetical protein ABZ607_24530, partial [Streptomyces sp. NPDC007369]
MSLTATGTAAADGQDLAPGTAGRVSAAGATSRTAGGTDPNGLTGLSAPTKTRPATLVSQEQCEPTPLGSRERQAGAVQACVTTSAAPMTPPGRQFLAAAAAAAAPPAAA